LNAGVWGNEAIRDGSMIEAFSEPFMRTALAGSCLAGICCGAIGAHVVGRRMAFLSEALAHATLPGVALAHLVGIDLHVGGMGAAVVAAIAVGVATRSGRIGEDTAIGIVFSAMLAAGVVIMDRAGTRRNLVELLFGSILSVGPSDLWFLLAGTLIVIGVLAAIHKELEMTACDPIHATSIGLSPPLVRQILLVLIAVTVMVALRVVGLVLTTALLVTPAATAGFLVSSTARVMVVAAVLASGCSFAGLLLSFHLNFPAGASIVIISALVFVLVKMSTRRNN